MRYRCMCVLFILFFPAQVLANCFAIDLSTWTEGQKGFLGHVVAVALGNLGTRQFFSANDIKICSETEDISAILSLVDLQSEAQAIVDSSTAETAAQQVVLDAALVEVTTNPLCTASIDDVAALMATEEAANQVDIDAADDHPLTQTALTTINERYGTILASLGRCAKSHDLLRQR